MGTFGGAPEGNQNAIKAKRWSLAIDAALAKRCKGDGIKALEELAEKLLLEAEKGDITALKELGDRIEGKPAQAITGEDGGPVSINVVRFTERVDVVPSK